MEDKVWANASETGKWMTNLEQGVSKADFVVTFLVVMWFLKSSVQNGVMYKK